MALKIFEKFSPRANPADADYPYGSIKNESVPGAKDGTPLDASWGNDMLGFTDALLDEAGITPNGSPDTVQSSQRLDALKTVARKPLELKIFQSPTDNLTKVSTFAGGVGAVYEVRKTSDNSLATIYSDKDSVNEIFQNGIVNVSDGDAEVVFYIADGDYKISIGLSSENFLVGIDAEELSNLSSLVFNSAADLKSGTLIGGASVNFSELSESKALVRTVVNNTSSSEGGRFYQIVKAADFNGAPDGNGDFYVGVGTSYVAKRTSRNKNTSSEFGATKSSIAPATNSAIQDFYSTSGDSTGGVVELPSYEASLDNTITIDNTTPFSVDGITLKGSGRQTTYLVASASFGDGVSVGYPIYVNLEDFGIRGCSGSGVFFDDKGGAAGNRNAIDRVQSAFNAVDGFTFERSFMTQLQSSEARQNGNAGFNWNAAVHTSWDVSNCYSLLNTAAGFRNEYMVYSSFTACGSDENQYGYQFFGSRGVHFDACGAEFNLRSGWLFQSDATHTENLVTGTGCVANDNNKANNGWANHTHVVAADAKPNKIVMNQPVSLVSTVAGTRDFISSGRGAVLVINDPIMENDGSQALNDGFVQHNYSAPTLVYQKTFTATSTAKIVDLKNQNGLTADYSGEILITCSNAAFGSGEVIGTSTYKLLISKSLAGAEVVEIAKVGLVNGAASNHPSFVFTVDATGNDLNATAQSSTAGDFWFAVEKIGGNIQFRA